MIELYHGSDLSHAAVDEQIDAVNETRVIRRQEKNRLGDLLGRSNPSGRDGRNHLSGKSGDLLLRQARLAVALGRDDACADGVDADLAIFEIRGPAARERAHSSLRSRVDAERRHALGTGHGSVKDNGAAIVK